MVRAMSCKPTLSLLALSASLAACFPSVDPPLAEIPKIAELETVMHANETLGKRLWGKSGKESYSDAELAELKELGQKMQALAERTKGLSRGPVFDKHAEKMVATTQALNAAVEAKDAKAAGAAIDTIKQTCKSCHADTK